MKKGRNRENGACCFVISSNYTPICGNTYMAGFKKGTKQAKPEGRSFFLDVLVDVVMKGRALQRSILFVDCSI